MKARNKFFIVIGIVIALSAGYYFLTTPRSNDIVLVGRVDASQVVVSPQIQGRITKLLVEEGSHVEKGDLIALLDESELETDKRASAATIESLRSKVSESENTWRSASGATAGDVANSEARLQTAQAQLAQAEATMARVESDSRRAIQLAQEGLVSDQEKVQAETNLRAQKATVQAAEYQVKSSQADLNSAIARTNQATAAQDTVAVSRAEVDNAEATMKKAEVHLGYARIHAPVTGTVLVRAAHEGEVVNAGQAIVTVVAFNDTWVFASIPETEADHITFGDSLRVRLPGGTVVPGRVFYKAAEADFATQRDVNRQKRDIRTIGLKVRLDNPSGTWVPGMTAEVLVPTAQLSEIAGTGGK